MDWNSARAKLIVAGPILIVLGFVLYVVRGDTVGLVFPVIGVILLIAGVIYKPRKKTENVTSDSPQVGFLDRWIPVHSLHLFPLF